MLNNKQHKWQDDLIHNVGLTFFKKDWVIKEIVYHPLKFTKQRMEDPVDERPIRIRYFATFVPKNSKNKERISKYKEIYRDYLKYKDILKSFDYKSDTEENFKRSMRHIGNKCIWEIDKIYELGSK